MAVRFGIGWSCGRVPEILQHGASASFSRHGHTLIVFRKISQLSATGRISEAIGQRSALLSATPPTLRACHSHACIFVVFISLGYGRNDPGEGPIEPGHFQ